MITGLKQTMTAATLLMLVTAAQSATTGFKPVASDLGHDKSVYLRQTTEFPLGQEFAFRLLQKLREMGTKNLVVEVLAELNPKTNEVFFGSHLDRANFDSYQSFVSAAHSAGMAVTFKLGLNLTNGSQLAEVSTSNPTEFLVNYKSFLRYYLKTAQKLTVEEVVIATGFTKLICNNSAILPNLIEFSEAFYKGAIRVDLASAKEASQLACYSKQKDHLVGIGVDLGLNPTAAQALDLANKGLLLSRVSFSGEKQSDLGVQFLASVPSGVAMTLGTFLPGPARAEHADSPVESEDLLSAITARFKK